MVILNRYKYIIVSVLMIISILSISVIQPKAELIDSINLVNNGNFSNGTTGWKNNTEGGVASVYNNEYSLTLGNLKDIGQTFFMSTYMTPQIVGHKYYVSLSYYPLYNSRLRIYFGDVDSYLDVIANQWNDRSIIITAVGSNPSLYMLSDFDTNGHQIGDVVKFKNIMIIDLTSAFGAGNEPNIIDCNAIYSEYFEGLKRQDIKPYDVTEKAHKTVIQMIVSTMLVPIDMLKSYKVGNQISLFDIFIGMIILVILTKTILKIGGKTSNDVR